MIAPDLVHAAASLVSFDPARAAALCRRALSADPNNNDARLLLSEALRLLGDLEDALQEAAAAAAGRPDWFGSHRQMGVVLAQMERIQESIAALRRAAELNPQHPTIWRDLGEQFFKAGARMEAQAAYARHGAQKGYEPTLMRAAHALARDESADAKSILTDHLSRRPDDVAALRLLSEAHARAGEAAATEATLRRCIDIAPRFARARQALVQFLCGVGRYEEALKTACEFYELDRESRDAQKLLAAVYIDCSELEKAIAIYERLLEQDATQASVWASYGNTLKAVGRTSEAIVAFRKCLALSPGFGDAYWSLANLKTFRFTADEVAEMERRVVSGGDANRVTIGYALAKALEDRNETERAFSHYRAAADLHRAGNKYDPANTSALAAEAIKILNASFFSARQGVGHPAPDPIFVVGMPRSGSTLLEQILASHSEVEGTMELPDFPRIARELAEGGGGSFLAAAATLAAEDFAALGARYLEKTALRRKTKRVRFVDKQLSNWISVGLIHLTLPNAKIIDARRHPLACCLSCYKQHFSSGLDFTYDLEHLGLYYSDYLRTMSHWDKVLPGRVYRVIHDDLTKDPERHIRALLDYCELPFEPCCLEPHKTARAVMTASSEQVRRPISSKQLNEWEKFDNHLHPLRRGLGQALERWRD
nr:tetratricopeptide repeat-containing sulfotransferase family protein [Nitrosomonas nitrosa]